MKLDMMTAPNGTVQVSAHVSVAASLGEGGEGSSTGMWASVPVPVSPLPLLPFPLKAALYSRPRGTCKHQLEWWIGVVAYAE